MFPIVKSGFNFAKKFFIVFFVFSLVISLFSYFIRKDSVKISTNPMEKRRQELYTIINDPKLTKTKEGKFLVSLYKVTVCASIGEVCTDNPEDGKKNFNNSYLGFMSRVFMVPYTNPPASGVTWTYLSLQNAGFVPKALAAEGIGFASMRPFMDLWKVFRDLAYMILVLVLIGIGFMIIFRMKINPQTVVSVENALPNIIVSLILITFSFAIAGFLIDLMYVIMAMAISVLSGNPSAPYFDVGEYQNKFLSANPGVIIDSLMPPFPLLDQLKNAGGIGSTLYTLLGTIYPMTVISKIANLGYLGVNLFLILPDFVKAFLYLLGSAGTLIGLNYLMGVLEKTGIREVADNVSAATFSVGKIPGGAIGFVSFVLTSLLLTLIMLPLIMALLIFLTVVFLFFRVFFILLTSYLKILLLVLFSPFFMLFNAIPGKKAFSYWFKNLFAELMSFPITAIILITGYVIINRITFTEAAAGVVGYDIKSASPFWAPPFLYGLNQYAYGFILGMGLLFIIPEIIKLSKELIGVKGGLPIPIGVGSFFAGTGAGVGGAMGILGKYSSIAIAFPGLRNIARKDSFIGKIMGSSKEAKEAIEQAPKAAGSTPTQEHG